MSRLAQSSLLLICIWLFAATQLLAQQAPKKIEGKCCCLTLTSGYLGGNLQPEAIKSQSGLVNHLNAEIKSFTMIYKSNGVISKADASGADFTERMKVLISRAKLGDQYIFEDIVMVDSGGQVIKPSSLTFTII